MKEDPFGNLTDWGVVLEIFDELAGADLLSECQPGLLRILRYKGNWRLREEVLKRAAEIQSPCHQLIRQVLNILDDDNIYYDVRILASDALIQMLKNIQDGFSSEINMSVRNVLERLRATPYPPIFHDTLTKLHSEICALERQL
ncbi:MAG: hypothetical protein RBT11_12705 [Desulfobacterales bacterium]|jgi:hypothetical protein|nr:hypothetical protein [Desulfobacterales bacterium]